METLQQFLAYAAAFEQTYVDDDWSRLEPYFAPDAVYEVRAEAFGCRLVGPKAILAGMKKSIDGFDRRFETRSPRLTHGPEVEGDEVRIGWEVTYEKAGVPTFILRGASVARLRDGRIAELRDEFEPSAERELDDWRQRSGMHVDVSYT